MLIVGRQAATHVLFSPKAGARNPYVSPTLKMPFSPTIPYVPLKFHIFPYIPYYHVNEIENSHHVKYGSFYANH